MAATDSPATEFHLFPRLPKELRLEIWKHSLPGPRIVDVSCTSQLWHWTTDESSPIHLEVNHEARAVALRSYERAPIWEYGRVPWMRTFVDYSRDFFYFHEEDFLDLFDDIGQRDASGVISPIRAEKTRFLVASVNRGQSWFECFLDRNRSPGSIDSAVKYLAPILEVFTALEMLVFVMDEGGSERFDDEFGKFKDIMDADAEWDDECWVDELCLGAPSPLQQLRRQYPHLQVPKIQFRRSIVSVKSDIQVFN
jgi:hypothetical protein